MQIVSDKMAMSIGATKTGGRARLSGFVRAFGNVSYKYNLDDQAHPSGVSSRTGNDAGVSWLAVQDFLEKFYKGGGGGVSCNVTEKLRLFRKSVVELDGNESTPELLDQTCVELVKMFLGQRKVSSEQIALLKRVQCSILLKKYTKS